MSHLIQHLYESDGTHLSNFVDESWSDYIQSMQTMHIYGDHLTLQRASIIFNVQFLVVSKLGVEATTLISKSGCSREGLPLLILGHFAEGHGEHYVSLHGPVSPFSKSIKEAELQLLFSSGSDISPCSGHDIASSDSHTGPDFSLDPQTSPGPHPDPSLVSNTDSGFHPGRIPDSDIGHNPIITLTVILVSILILVLTL